MNVLEYAERMHRDQVDKTGAPYIDHCRFVAMASAAFAIEAGFDFHRIGLCTVVGALHDVVEDTPAHHDDIHRLFGAEVSDAVRILTKTIQQSRENYLRAVAAHPVARIVKMADTLHNSDVTRFPEPTQKQRKMCVRYWDEHVALREWVQFDA